MAQVISQEEISRVVAAIRAAEKTTSAEIFAVVCRQSSDYRFAGYAFLLFWIIVLSFLLALGMAWLALDPVAAWTGSWPSGPQSSIWILVAFSGGQLAAAASGMALVRLFPALPVLVVPSRIAREHAHRNAVSQFLAHGLDATSGRNGVLVFVSLAEHYAEILVDRGIEDSLGRQVFLDQVAQLVEDCRQGEITTGYCRAIQAIGAMLSERFPPQSGKANEIEDRMVVL